MSYKKLRTAPGVELRGDRLLRGTWEIKASDPRRQKAAEWALLWPSAKPGRSGSGREDPGGTLRRWSWASRETRAARAPKEEAKRRQTWMKRELKVVPSTGRREFAWKTPESRSKPPKAVYREEFPKLAQG